MPTSTIVPIVEGPGEVEALPLLLRRMFEHKGRWNIKIQRPINAHGISNIIKPNGLERFLRLASKRDSCDAVLLLLDAEGDCAKEVAEQLSTRAKIYNPLMPTAVVAAKHHYENWILGSAETIAGQRGLQKDLDIINDPESIPDPKR